MARQQDPEHELDPLLRQVLQPSAAGLTDSCVAAETLAAWADGTLRRDEAAAVEQHAADCARCRAMLAAFVRSDVPPPVGDAVADAVTAPFWQRWRLQWLVPIAATATALAVFIAAPEAPAPAFKEAPGGAEMAPAEPSPAPAAAMPSEPAAVPGPAPRMVGQAGANDSAPAAAPRPSEARSKAEMETGFAPIPDAGADRRVITRAEPTAENDALARDTAALPAAPAPPSSPPREDAPAPAREPVGAALAAATAPPSPLTESPANGQRSRLAPGVRALSVGGTDTSARWRSNGALLERSADGVTWRPVSVPAGVDVGQLSAGAAAGPQAIWLVGRAGLVLVSADGVTFRRTAPPGPVDLVSVLARDARAASVVSSDGRRFDTTDGGATWVVP